MNKSMAELYLHDQLLHVPEIWDWEREYCFYPTRKWRFDFAFPEIKVAVEIEGGTAAGKSRHTRPAGFEKDCEKYNTAACDGWLVLRFTTRQVISSEALPVILKLLERRQDAVEAQTQAQAQETISTQEGTGTPVDPEAYRLVPFQELFIVRALSGKEPHRLIEWVNNNAPTDPQAASSRSQSRREAVCQGQTQEDSCREGLSEEGEGPTSRDLQSPQQDQQCKTGWKDFGTGGCRLPSHELRHSKAEGQVDACQEACPPAEPQGSED